MIHPTILDEAGRIAYSDVPLGLRVLLLSDLVRRKPWLEPIVSGYMEMLSMDADSYDLDLWVIPPWAWN